MGKRDYLEKSKVYKGFHYSVLKPEMLEYLHRRTLEMFVEVKRIFEENDIPYMICGGTLLGAIGGGNGHFIPWDDDLDLCVFEEDYEKVAECLAEELGGGMRVQCTKTDPNYYLGWMKVRDQNSYTYPDAPRFQENGVWIDIYKLVKAKKKDVSAMVAKEAIDYLDRRLAADGLTEEEYEERIKKGRLREKLEKAELKNGDSTSVEAFQNVYVIWSASKIVVDEKWVKPLSVVRFEGMKVTTFGNPEGYLLRHYGEKYNSFPPDEMRRVGINKIEIRK